MTKRLVDKPGYLRAILDASPSPMFILDSEACVLDTNLAASEFLQDGSGAVFRRPCGDVLQCLHQRDSAKDCGTTPLCKDCLIRNSVIQAVEGNRVVREKTRLLLCTDDEVKKIDVLISASPFEYEGTPYALLVIEDITDLAMLQNILPICARCKKIRNDQSYWEQVEIYLSRHTDLRFTHGICPECARILYPDLHPS